MRAEELNILYMRIACGVELLCFVLNVDVIEGFNGVIDLQPECPVDLLRVVIGEGRSVQDMDDIPAEFIQLGSSTLA